MINNYHKWFNLDFEIVYFFKENGHGQIKNQEMAAVIGILEFSAVEHFSGFSE